MQGVSPATHDLHIVEPERLDHLLEESGAAQQRLDQRHLEVGAPNRQHQTWQPGAAADVTDSGGLRDGVGQHCTVDQVALPQPRGLAGSDQAANHAVSGEESGVLLSKGQALGRENPLRRFRHSGRSRCFT